MKRLFILTLISTALAAAIFFLKKRTPTTVAAGHGLVIPKNWLATNAHPQTPKEDVRPPDQTFLTFPEWFLVFSPDEQAHSFIHRTATGFPFMAHTAQIWESYGIVKDQIRGNFPVNTGYHFMIWVIGSSATAEYAIKALYETVVGRLTDTGAPLTEEDKFNAVFTADYVRFIKDRPWYEFDFKSRLKTLWTQIPVTGDHLLRKLDRRYILTAELLVKWGYGKLIGLGTKTVYEEALPTTAVIITCDGRPSLLKLPRYDRFTEEAMALSKKGCLFNEITGNKSAILLTVWVPAGTDFRPADAVTVFTQPITSNPQWKRIALAVPVKKLNSLLLQIADQKITIEHVFDF